MQVVVDILRAIDAQNGRAKPTHILYKSNLSHKLLKEYLNNLLQNKMIEVEIDGNRTFYKITKKGRDFIVEFRKVEKLSQAFGLPV